MLGKIRDLLDKKTPKKTESYVPKTAMMQRLPQRTPEEWVRLARAQQAAGEMGKAAQLVAQALKLDPAHYEALSLWVEIYRDKLIADGMRQDKAYYRVLLEADKRFQGVLPKLWIGSFCASHEQKALALDWFSKALAIEPIHADSMTHVSAELVQKAWYEDIINLLSSRYQPKRHGAACGINLLRSYYEFKDVDAGDSLVAAIKELNDPAQAANLAWYEEAFQTMKAPKSTELAMSWSFVQIPIWCYGFSKSPMGFEGEPADKRVVIFQFTDESEQAELGMFSRVLPLHLAQQVSSHGDLGMEFLFPIMNEKDLVLLPNIPVDKEQIQAEFTGQYAGVIMGEWENNQWLLTYLDLDNQTEISQTIPFDPNHPQTSLNAMNDFIAQATALNGKPLTDIPAPLLRSYLQALDQHLSLYVTLQYPEEGEPSNLSQMIHHALDLAIELPNMQTELLLLGTIQKCMRFQSLIIKDSQSALLAWLDKRALDAGPLQSLIAQTQGEFRAYCEG